MQDNVDFYRRFLFELPSAKMLVIASVVLGSVFGILSTFLLSPRTSISVTLIGAAVVSVCFYILPGIVSGIVLSRLGQVTEKWAFLISILDEAVLFLFSLTLLLADTVMESWQVMWLGLATIYTINLLLVLVAKGRQQLYLNFLYPLVFPGLLLAVFHVFIGRLVGLPKTIYLQNSILFLLSGFLLILTFGMFEFIIRANVSGVSVFDFTSAIILGEERALQGGLETDVRHQSLRIDNGEEHVYTVPAVHPGPVEGFGGGKLTPELIKENTFFLHVPSDHTLDLADPKEVDRFRTAPPADMQGQATKLLKESFGNFTLWGRKYGGDEGKRIIYIQNREIDDYDPALIREIMDDHEDIMLIDLHNQEIGSHYPRLQVLDKRAKTLRKHVQDMLDRLEDTELHEYRAGTAGNSEYHVLVEEVDEQRTCLMGVDGNDLPPFMYGIEDMLADRFDEALLFTTDSHKRLVELASPRAYDAEELLSAADTAEANLATAEAGIGETYVERVNVLGDSYNGLINTLNIMGRLVPISLLLYYIGVIFLVL